MSKKKKITRIILLILTILLNGYIIMNSCFTSSVSTSSSSWVMDLFKNMVNLFSPNFIHEGNIETFSYVIRKLIGHFGLCLIDGLITTVTVSLYMKNESHLKLTAISLNIGLFVSILTEKIQLFIPGRVGDGLDSFIDFIGYLTGFLIILIFLYFHHKRIKKQTKNNKE